MRTRWIVLLTASLALLVGVLTWVGIGAVGGATGWFGTGTRQPSAESGSDFTVTGRRLG